MAFKLVTLFSAIANDEPVYCNQKRQKASVLFRGELTTKFQIALQYPDGNYAFFQRTEQLQFSPIEFCLLRGADWFDVAPAISTTVPRVKKFLQDENCYA